MSTGSRAPRLAVARVALITAASVVATIATAQTQSQVPQYAETASTGLLDPAARSRPVVAPNLKLIEPSLPSRGAVNAASVRMLSDSRSNATSTDTLTSTTETSTATMTSSTVTSTTTLTSSTLTSTTTVTTSTLTRTTAVTSVTTTASTTVTGSSITSSITASSNTLTSTTATTVTATTDSATDTTETATETTVSGTTSSLTATTATDTATGTATGTATDTVTTGTMSTASTTVTGSSITSSITASSNTLTSTTATTVTATTDSATDTTETATETTVSGTTSTLTATTATETTVTGTTSTLTATTASETTVSDTTGTSTGTTTTGTTVSDTTGTSTGTTTTGTTVSDTTGTSTGTTTSATSTTTFTHTAIRARLISAGSTMSVGNPEQFAADPMVRMSLANSYATLAGVATSQCEVTVSVSDSTQLRRLSRGGSVQVDVMITLVSMADMQGAANASADALNSLNQTSLASQVQTDLAEVGVMTEVVVDNVMEASVEEITLTATTQTTTITTTATSTTTITISTTATTTATSTTVTDTTLTSTTLTSTTLTSVTTETDTTKTDTTVTGTSETTTTDTDTTIPFSTTLTSTTVTSSISETSSTTEHTTTETRSTSNTETTTMTSTTVTSTKTSTDTSSLISTTDTTTLTLTTITVTATGTSTSTVTETTTLTSTTETSTLTSTTSTQTETSSTSSSSGTSRTTVTDTTTTTLTTTTLTSETETSTTTTETITTTSETSTTMTSTLTSLTTSTTSMTTFSMTETQTTTSVTETETSISQTETTTITSSTATSTLTSRTVSTTTESSSSRTSTLTSSTESSTTKTMTSTTESGTTSSKTSTSETSSTLTTESSTTSSKTSTSETSSTLTTITLTTVTQTTTCTETTLSLTSSLTSMTATDTTMTETSTSVTLTGAHTTLAEDHQAGTTVLIVVSQSGFRVGGRLIISDGGNSETHTIAGFGSIILTMPLQYNYSAGSAVMSIVETTATTTSASDTTTTLSVTQSLTGTMSSTASDTSVTSVTEATITGTTDTTTTTTQLACTYAPSAVRTVGNLSDCDGYPHGGVCAASCGEGMESSGSIVCNNGVWQNPVLYCVQNGLALVAEPTPVLSFTMTIDAGNSSDLSVEWAWSVEKELKQALADSLGVYYEQIHITDITVGPGRRLSAGSGLQIGFLVDTYDALDNSSTVTDNIYSLGGGSPMYLTALQDLLGDEAPPALRTARIDSGTVQGSEVVVPQAKWITGSDWDDCSELCGEGLSWRQVECTTGNSVLCNANSPREHISGDVSSFLPDVKECKKFTQCPSDPFCPMGPDPETGEGCVAQGALFGSVYAVVLLICTASSAIWCRRQFKKPTSGKANLNWKAGSTGSRSSALRSASWTITPGQNGGKERVTWDIDANLMQRMVDAESGHSPQSERHSRELEPSEVDLGVRRGNFRLTALVTTTCPNGFIMGKTFEQGRRLPGDGEAKTVSLQDGKMVLQIGSQVIRGMTVVSDGNPHEIGIEYSEESDDYVIRVDNSEDVRGLKGVEDHPHAVWMIGKPLSDDAIGADVQVLTSHALRVAEGARIGQNTQALMSPAQPASSGSVAAASGAFDIDGHSQQWNHEHGRDFDWDCSEDSQLSTDVDLTPLAFGVVEDISLHRRLVDDKGEYAWRQFMIRQVMQANANAATTSQGTSSDLQEIVVTPMRTGEQEQEAYEFGAQVEYFSGTQKAWVHARAQEASAKDNNSAARQFMMPKYDCLRTFDEKPVKWVSMQRLRAPLRAGELCEMYSKRDGAWVPGVVTDRSAASMNTKKRNPTLGYSISLVGPKTSAKRPDNVSGVPPALVRRRFVEGSRVQVYSGPRFGWVNAEVVSVVPAEQTVPEAAISHELRPQGIAVPGMTGAGVGPVYSPEPSPRHETPHLSPSASPESSPRAARPRSPPRSARLSRQGSRAISEDGTTPSSHVAFTLACGDFMQRIRVRINEPEVRRFFKMVCDHNEGTADPLHVCLDAHVKESDMLTLPSYLLRNESNEAGSPVRQASSRDASTRDAPSVPRDAGAASGSTDGNLQALARRARSMMGSSATASNNPSDVAGEDVFAI